MRSEWPEYTVQHLVDEKVLAKPKDGNHGSIHPKSSDYVDSGVPFIMATDMIENGVDFKNCKYITEKMAASLRKGFAEPGDVLLSHKATIGRTSILQNHAYSTIVLTPQVTYYRVLNEEVLNNKYLHYYFKSEGFQNLLNSWAGGGSTRAYLGITDQRKLPIAVPPIDAQKNIAKILGDLDQKIHLNQQTNETLEAMTQAIFKSWFVDFDPVRAKMRAKTEGRDANQAAMAAIGGVDLEQDWDEIEAALNQKLSRMSESQRRQLHQTAELFPDELVDSELGEVPKGWGVKSLDEIADYLNGKAMQKYPPEDGKDTLPVLKIAQLRKGDTDGADIATADIPEKFKISDGDMIFSWSGSLLVKLWAGGEAALNQHLFKVTSQEYDQWLYYHWTKFHLANFIRIAESKAVTMGHIKRSHLKEAKCVIPGNELLEFGKQHIEPLLAQALQQNLESRNLAELRDTLLPKLISGEIGL